MTTHSDDNHSDDNTIVLTTITKRPQGGDTCDTRVPGLCLCTCLSVPEFVLRVHLPSFQLIHKSTSSTK